MTKNIWPRQLPKRIRSDRRRRAEVKVYDRVASDLADEYHVFYSSPWLAIDRFGNEKDGECDFVVAHERLGVLAIEVKGGGIAFEPETGQWTSTDGLGVTHNIKDPVEQARSAKHNILDKLKSSSKWSQKWIHLRHGVIFPDASTPPADLGADRPARIFCASYQFNHGLGNWIDDRFRDANGGNRGGVGRDGIAALERLFAFPFSLSFTISGAVSEDVRSLDLLEPQQFLVLDYISKIPRARIEGAAGTGKTVLAVEAATRSGREGMRTLLSYSEEYLPELLIKALCSRKTLRFDHIVVDEGQDFHENWWIALDDALSEGGSNRVFFDSNQRLYDFGSEFVDGLDLVPIPLNINLRNTRRIHEASMAHYSGPGTSALGPLGLGLEWVEVEAVSGMAKAAFGEVMRLVYREEMDPGKIAVLVADREARDAFMIVSARSGLAMTDAESVSSEAVVVDTVRRYKGLERPVIVLCVAGAEKGLTELAYTGMTRARAALSIVCQKKDRHWIEHGWLP